MINLQYPLRLILNDGWGVNVLAFGISALLALPLFPLLLSGMEASGPALLRSVSLLAVVQLLVIYHRDYDAVLLSLPLAWALSPHTSPRQARPAIVLIAVFFVPVLHVLYWLDQSSVLRPLSSTLLWEFVLWPYQTWALLGLAAWLSYCSLPLERGVLQTDREAILTKSEVGKLLNSVST
jgi:hypothetical protein